MVNEINAYKFSDNFTIQTVAAPVNVIGCEHNREEAEAIAKYLTGENGYEYVVVKNSRADVAAAKAFRSQPMRYAHREEALRAMKVWPSK